MIKDMSLLLASSLTFFSGTREYIFHCSSEHFINLRYILPSSQHFLVNKYIYYNYILKIIQLVVAYISCSSLYIFPTFFPVRIIYRARFEQNFSRVEFASQACVASMGFHSRVHLEIDNIYYQLQLSMLFLSEKLQFFIH